MTQMHQLLLDAAMQHPERTEYERALESGMKPERAARLLAAQTPLTLRAGRSVWRVQNNPAMLEVHASEVAKCTGFNGKKTPKPRAVKSQGSTYTHPCGFRLFVPNSMRMLGESCITLGAVTLKLHHQRETVTGTVPPSWMVDLNGGPVAPDDDEYVPGWDLA